MELVDQLKEVKDEKSFLEFARALQADKEDENKKEKIKASNPYDSGRNGWENSTIEGFLESAIVWAEDSDFGEHFEANANLWKKFAMFLYGGKIYE